MLTAPAHWDALWGRIREEAVRMELKAVIGGLTYDRVLSCKAYPAAFDALAIGQAASAELSLSFVPLGPVPRTAKIELYVRLTDQMGVTTAWVPQGTYYIDTREMDTRDFEAKAGFGVLSINAFDRMLFAEEPCSSGLPGTWPRPATEAVQDICTRLGIPLDSRSQIDSALMVPAPVNLTMRDVLRNIAAAHGGNFIITAENKLRLLPLEDAPGMSLLGDENRDYVADEYGNRVLLIDGASPFLSLPCETAKSTGDRVTISKVELKLNEKQIYFAGNDTGYTLTADCLYADQAAADRALDRVQNIRYDPAEATGVVFSPLLELGDALYSGGSLFRVYRMEVDYDLLFVADLSAPIDGDVEHEIPYQNAMERFIDQKIDQAMDELSEDFEDIDGRIDDLTGRLDEIGTGSWEKEVLNISVDETYFTVTFADSTVSVYDYTVDADGRMTSITKKAVE